MENLNGQKLWIIYVPCVMNDYEVRLNWHKAWDRQIQKIAGGLTILTPTKGQWLDCDTKIICEEKVIPVQIACTEEQINEIIDLTIKHYNQKMVMAYLVSDKVIMRSGK